MDTLFYGDNLNILRDYIKDESVDLIYLDPPFNSNRNHNVLFKDESGTEDDPESMKLICPRLFEKFGGITLRKENRKIDSLFTIS